VETRSRSPAIEVAVRDLAGVTDDDATSLHLTDSLPDFGYLWRPFLAAVAACCGIVATEK
jgi:hypothetical protein